ncbi:MAG: bifunctional UDP-N-acetylglucosamine diphosphorylase/glucosamine-1-phosphate N-acetyltransferase GlmU [Halanaerobiales bacterium]|jgi:bifunctional UDP-N-acetylglucosamine pyrophosphorylase/glucosamine-1-phosphate N-acetyltransferase
MIKMNNVLTIILAAGQGTRMKSDRVKVLHHVAGRPMLHYVVDNAGSFSSSIVLIIGRQGEMVRESLAGKPNLKFIVQEEQLGTGHAVIQAREEILKHSGPVLVLYGDTPLLREETLRNLIKIHEEKQAASTVLTTRLEDPTGYGRIIRDKAGNLVRIVEERDAGAEEKAIREINSGVCCFDSSLLLEALANLDNKNAQGEYYLTDTIAYLNDQGKKVLPYLIEDYQEIIGINDRKNLARAERIIRDRINEKHLENGVTMIDPATIYIDSEVEIGQDTLIYPFTYIEGKTSIGKNSIIGSHCRIKDSKIGEAVNIMDHSIILDSQIGAYSQIGPFAHIRPGCLLETETKIGGFVEIKNTTVGQGTKIPHLSYVGDASIGQETNVGAGTIFANYDGEKKHQTIVGDKVFIGSNTTLVSPVKIGDEGKTGAGSVVTRDVPEKTTVVGVPARKFVRKER